MTQYVITSGTRLLYRRLNLRMVERRGDQIDWTCDRTHQSFTFTDAELAELAANDQAKFLGVGGGAPDPTPDPEDVSDADLATAQRKLAYVEAVLKAALPRFGSVAEYEGVVKAEGASLGDPRIPSSRSVKRWVERAGDPPDVYRLLDRNSAKGNRTDRVTDAQRAVIDDMIDNYHLRRTHPSIDSLVSVVRDEVNERNEKLVPELRMTVPGRRAVETVLLERPPEDVAAARFGKAYAHQKYGAVHRQADPEAPLDRVELDHTRADIFVVSEEDHLPIGRPTIGFAIDRCTRMPLGLYVGFEEPSVLTVMQILRHAMLPKTYVDRMVESGEWNLRHRWEAWGTPRTIVMDRARENLGRDLRPSLRELGVRDVVFAAARQGRQKGAVERFFRKLNQNFLHEQRGTTYSNIVDRGDYNPEKNAVLTLPELNWHLHRFFVDIHPHAPHKGLMGDLPARVWKERIHLHPAAPPRPLAEIVHLFTRTERRVLGREGIRLFNMEYWSADIDQIRRSPDFSKAIAAAKRDGGDGKVLVRYDPADLAHVWVQSHDKRYVKVPVGARWSEYAPGKSIWEHEQAMKHLRITVDAVFDPDGLAKSRRALIDETDAAGARLTRKRRYKARMDGVGRTSPAGDDASTSPADSAFAKRQRGRRTKPDNDNRSTGGAERAPAPRAAAGLGAPPGYDVLSFEED